MSNPTATRSSPVRRPAGPQPLGNGETPCSLGHLIARVYPHRLSRKNGRRCHTCGARHRSTVCQAEKLPESENPGSHNAENEDSFPHSYVTFNLTIVYEF